MIFPKQIHKQDWGPGFRYFKCEECNHEFKEATRHCESMSLETCPKCRSDVFPGKIERHYEWPTDKNGNLLKYEGNYDV